MAKCWKCGKRGWFLSLSAEGLCEGCIQERKAQIDRLTEDNLFRKKRELEEFRKIFPIASDNNNMQEEWALNSCDHDSQDQVVRQKRALEDTVPIQINTDTHDGIFLSSGRAKLYNTSLLMCDCADYDERDFPCKHMYRLFYEIEHLEKTNTQILNISPDIRIEFRNLSNETQMTFVNFVSYSLHARVLYVNSQIKMLIQHHFFTESTDIDYSPFLEEMTKDSIILAMAKCGISGYRPSWSKVRLIDWVMENQPEFLSKQFKNYSKIGIDLSVLDWAAGISLSINARYSRRTYLLS